MLRALEIAFVIALVVAVTGCGGGSSGSSLVSISSISPTTAAPGSPDITLSVKGSNFVNGTHNGSHAAWSANGSETFLATTFVSSTQLMAIVPAALLANAGTAQVLVETGDPMGDIPPSKSNSVTFSISTPPLGPPSISSIAPTSAVAGSPDITLNIMGSNLAGKPHDVRRPVWSANGTMTNLGITSVSSNQLTVVIPASLMSSPVAAQVFIAFGDPMADVPLANSNSLNFSVTSTAQSAATLSPSNETLGPHGTRQFMFTIAGKGADAVWALEEGASGGKITPEGFYTAAATPGIYHLTATSVADSSKSATAILSVVPSGFSLVSSMNSGRSGHTATLLKDGKVLILGGGDRTAEVFDPASGTFSLTGNPLTNRLAPSATLLADGRVLITGGVEPGSTGPFHTLDTAEIFDPVTGTFAPTGNMLEVRHGHTATLLNSGRVLITGGNGSGFCTVASSEVFDPATGTFSSTESLLSENGRVNNTATLLNSGDVLIAGGSNGCRPDAADDPPWDPLFVELYNVTSGSFQMAGNMSTTRIDHAAIRLTNGNVLMLGGIPTVQNLHEQPANPAYAEHYDPARLFFSPVSGFSISQKRYTATLLTSGKVLIAGGVDEAGRPTSEAGLVDPATSSLTATGDLATARVGHTATLLNDGRVLVTGGIDSSGNATATSEVYK